MDFLIKQASSIAGEMDLVIWIIALLTGFWLIVAELCLFGFIFKFRRKPGVKGQYVTGEKKEEMKWIHLPHNLILACDVVILVFAVRLWYHVKQELPTPDETIQVIGQQWSWRFVHPGLDKQLGTADDVETVDELRVKVGKTYHFKLEAADVLHDFSIPVFRLKQDAIPGRVVTGWFKPTAVGQFDIQCAEMCGIGHGIMQAKLFVESESDHVKWLVKQGENQI
jgi:cytochrome c oxidase subunit 2